MSFFVYVTHVCLFSQYTCLYVFVCVCTYPFVSFLTLYSERAVYCAHTKALDKLLWIWQLNDSSPVGLEENCLVKVFTKMTEIKSYKKQNKKQCTMVLKSPMEIFLCCSFLLSTQLFSSPSHADVKPARMCLHVPTVYVYASYTH